MICVYIFDILITQYIADAFFDYGWRVFPVVSFIYFHFIEVIELDIPNVDCRQKINVLPSSMFLSHQSLDK